MNIRNIFHRPTNFFSQIDWKQFWLGLLIVVAIIGVGGCYYFYHQYQTVKANPNLEAQQQSAALITALGKLIELPKNETPTIATISDKAKLAGQTFFENSVNGDILFAYTTAMKAILYRPSTNKIINVAPININQQPNLTQGATPTSINK